MALSPTSTTHFRSIPSTDNDKFEDAVKEVLEIGIGQRGDVLDRFVTLRDLIDPTVVRYLNDQEVSVTRADQGIQGQTRVPDAPSNLILQSTDDAGRISAFNIALTWTLPDDDMLSATEIWMSTTNNRSTAVRVGVVTYPQDEYVYVNPKPDTDHYFWIRVIDWAGNYSEWEPSGTTAGFVVQGDDSLDETINRVLDALRGEDPATYNPATSYVIGDRVKYTCADGKTRTYRCISACTGQAPASGDPPTTNSTYWERHGILLTGEVDGESVVGIDGNMVVDGTIITRNLDADCVTATKIAAGAITAAKIAVGAVNWDTHISGERHVDDLTDGELYGKMPVDWPYMASTLIDGAKIYTGTVSAAQIEAGAITAPKIAADAITAEKIQAGIITADKFESVLFGDLNQAMYYVKTIMSAGDEYSKELSASDISGGTLSHVDGEAHFDYGLALRLEMTRLWDDASAWWDQGSVYWDHPTDSSGYFQTASIDMGSTKTLQLSAQYNLFEDAPASTSVTIRFQYSTAGTSWGANPPNFDDNNWETATITQVSGSLYRASGTLHTKRYYKCKFELSTTDTSKRIILDNIVFLGNVVNMYGYLEGKAIAAAGTSFTLTGYHATPAVIVTPVSTTAKTACVYNVSSSGFDVKLYNSSGTAVSGTANIIIMGV